MFDSLTSKEIVLKFFLPCLIGTAEREADEIEIFTKDFYPNAEINAKQMCFVVKPIFTKHKPDNECRYWYYVMYSDVAIEVFCNGKTLTYICFDVLERILKMGKKLDS